MSFMDEMKNVFSRKTPEQIYVESVLKEIRQRDDLIKTVSQMSTARGPLTTRSAFPASMPCAAARRT